MGLRQAARNDAGAPSDVTDFWTNSARWDPYRQAVINIFGGWANEIRRDIIAMAGLGLPRAPHDLRATAQ
ncbi:hypothetical protein A5677_15990 [Mycobacterium malmoense]|uniref:Uncharacterized protein n=1 Tax=Mycobacterium malmoense TaxID=1780 RepID=A0A1B9DBA7_MYCMA|nr:hypothetical protein A5677_15990 [Mycobacterium malmoense]